MRNFPGLCAALFSSCLKPSSEKNPTIVTRNSFDEYLKNTSSRILFLLISLLKKKKKRASYLENKLIFLYIILKRSPVISQCLCKYSVLKKIRVFASGIYNFLAGNLCVCKLQYRWFQYRWFQCNSAQTQVSELESWIPSCNRGCSPAQVKAARALAVLDAWQRYRWSIWPAIFGYQTPLLLWIFFVTHIGK